MQKGMREYLEKLEKNGALKKLKTVIHPHNISSIIAKSPQGVYMNVEGYDIPVVGGIVRNTSQIALALNCEPKEIGQKFNHALKNPIDPVMVTEAQCQEIVHEGEDVDLTMFPLTFQHEKDGGPYIGSAVQFATWADYGINAGMYRHMFRTKNTVNIDLNSPNDVRLFFSEANKLGKPLQIASVIGLHPTELLSGTYSAPTGFNEMKIAGALRGEPVEMVQCKTIDVAVPANAEIVLECEVLPKGWNYDEGRYGEFHNVSGTLKNNPLVKIKAITHRKNPIFYSLLMPYEVYGLNSPLLEAMAWNILETARIRPEAVRAPLGACGFFELIVSLKNPNPGEGKAALTALLSLMGVKLVTVVDDDIDIYNDDELKWCFALRVQPDKDVLIVSNTQAKHMDPTVYAHKLPAGQLPTTSKMGIDATIPPDISPYEYERVKYFKYDQVNIPE